MVSHRQNYARVIGLLLLMATHLWAAVARVDLTCQPPTTGLTPTGYNFYRATSATGTPILLNQAPLSSCSYVDLTAVRGKTYFYTAASVNGTQVSSYAMPYVKVPIPRK